MGATRFSVNLASMIVRFMVGAAFAMAASPMQGFAFVGTGLGIFALLAIVVAQRLGKTLSNQTTPEGHNEAVAVVERGYSKSATVTTVGI